MTLGGVAARQYVEAAGAVRTTPFVPLDASVTDGQLMLHGFARIATVVDALDAAAGGPQTSAPQLKR